MGKVKNMVAQWADDGLVLDTSYDISPSSSKTEAAASPAPAEEAPAEEAPAEDGGGMSQGECAGPEGCEIVWD
jgi:hypothetical protein